MARAECPPGARFDRKGTPDAGVECFIRLGDGGEWGWQAKYFDSLGPSQWSQLDGSVKNALDKHPGLVRYYICVPLDRADARIVGQKSALERWNEHVEKWQSWARDRGVNLEFVWWGSSELLEMLSTREHVGRLLFWFGQLGFDQSWFQLHLDIAIESAGPRYTQPLHVELPIARDMERFTRCDEVFNEVKSLAPGIRRDYRALQAAVGSFNQPFQGPELDDLLAHTDKLLEALLQLEPSPIGEVPFAEISNAAGNAMTAASEISRLIWEMQPQSALGSPVGRAAKPYHEDPIGNSLYYLRTLQSGLGRVVDACDYANSLANSRLLLLQGVGGSGKTHLLCDLSEKRVRAGLPTVLMLGHRFLSNEDPWTQTLQQLDLSNASVEEFVGALESAAQIADSRALLIVDALNEGNGRTIWPAHMAAFLERVGKSEWIAVLLSVRSGFERVVPEDIRQSATIVTHHGFSGQEYDATSTFFRYYNIELPGGPALNPEFQNPLFLKILCEGLIKRPIRKLPQGSHGISTIFEWYLNVLNERLADPQRLDYDPSDRLVHQAVGALAKQLPVSHRWLPRNVARQIVDDLLPGRGFSKSLYQGLIAENLLMELSFQGGEDGSTNHDFVLFSYERYADHLAVNQWITEHVDQENPEAAFADGGGLQLLFDEDGLVPSGILDALSIQVPERLVREFVGLAPGVLEYVEARESFLNSLLWRNQDAFSQETVDLLTELLNDEYFATEAYNALLAAATLSDHPFNADFLDRVLRDETMADRDARWSIYLHEVRGTEGPVDRLLDWASASPSNETLEKTEIDLAATALAWMLCTPNRPLRDKATQALVSLLTPWPECTVELVDRFSAVNDPYVLERVYAVSYGVAMRSNDADGICDLASLVYRLIFTSGTPPAHVLIRDYARGVVERAIFLGCDLEITEEFVRPPYRSLWPPIPCQDCIEDLYPEETRMGRKQDGAAISRNLIKWSVKGGDFSRYVLGSDSGSSWLSLPLSEEPWMSPDERKQSLVSQFDEHERSAWQEHETAQSELFKFPPPLLIDLVDESKNVVESLHSPPNPVEDHAREQALANLVSSKERLMDVLTPAHRDDWEAIERDNGSYDGRHGPRLDLGLIQRYILWRVLDLGWSVERFGAFDRFVNWGAGREAAKPERMGKKYQWIAYHEILAYVSDHYQYREGFLFGQRDKQFEGPWQEYLRDIDPSRTLASIPGGTVWGPHEPAWWGPLLYQDYKESASHQEWLASREDIPSIEHLLETVHPTDGSRWSNLNGSFIWRQPHPADQGAYEQSRREFRIGFTAYFVNEADTNAFMEWAEAVDLFGRSMPDPRESGSVYLGEYGWSPAFRHSFPDCTDGEDWVRPIWTPEPRKDGIECSGEVRSASFVGLSGSNGFDCFAEESYALRLPHPDLITRLNLQWSGHAADYCGKNGSLAAFDPTAHEDGPSSLLLRRDLLEQYLAENGLALCWVILGEKLIVGGPTTGKYYGRLKMSGAYLHTTDGPVGFLNFALNIPRVVDEPHDEESTNIDLSTA